MTVQPTVNVQWELTEGGGAFTNSSDVIYPLSFSYGFGTNAPGFPHVATPGMATFFYDNTSSDLPYTIQDTDISARTGKKLGVQHRIYITYDTMFHSFIGRVDEWFPVPGVVDERISEVTLRDYIGNLTDYNITGLSVQSNVTADVALDDVASEAPNDAMPYSPPGYFYSTNGEIFTKVFHDLEDNQGKFIKAFQRIAGSELGHAFCSIQSYDTGGQDYSLIYKTNDDWINMGRSSIGTLDNQFLSLETVASKDLEYAPIYVRYSPTVVSDSTEVLFTLQRIGHVKPGETTYLRVNYTDPNTKNVTVACIDSDVITPVSGTDYLVSYTSGSTDNAASSDLTINLTNKGSAAELEFINSNSSDNLYLSLLQVRGTPIYTYDQETIFSTDDITLMNSLSLRLPYADNRDLTENVLNFYKRLLSGDAQKTYARSVSFMATADSDTMKIACDGHPGRSVKIIEDVNLINDDFRITHVSWDILSPQAIVVTWELYPEEYNNLVMMDSNGVTLCDSTGADFAFWR